MTMQSMTGFARADGAHGSTRFHWELRSVNGRSLDVRLRLPPGHDELEVPTREALTKQIARGSVAATLVVEQASESGAVRINEQALKVVLDAVERLSALGSFERPRPEGVLALRGVIEVGSAPADAPEVAELRGAMLAALGQAIDALVASRRLEGGRLQLILSEAVDGIEHLVNQISEAPARSPAAVERRLAEQIARLTTSSSRLEPDKLHQEAMLLATRIDIEEELKRLGAHIAAARGLLAEPVPVGRRLDFLTQEFNREANTICSKANDVDITRHGLALKAVIDQVREQVQNIE